MKVSFDGKFMTMVAEDDQDLDVFKRIQSFQDTTTTAETYWHFDCFDLSGQHFRLTPGDDQILFAVEYI